jgi:hypothetical protein
MQFTYAEGDMFYSNMKIYNKCMLVRSFLIIVCIALTATVIPTCAAIEHRRRMEIDRMSWNVF